MLGMEKRKSIDLLVEHFWKHGYLTLSRKFGTYLPEPSKVGQFDVDIVARYKKNYAIGITLVDEDFKNPNIIEKLSYLATRQTKFSNKRVQLFIGVPEDKFKTAKVLLDNIDTEVRKNIKLFPIVEKAIRLRRNSNKEISFFS